MPEGDTIFRTARTLQKTLAGHRVTKFDTAYAHLARVNDDRPIAGRLIERCEAAGKHVLIVFQGDLILRTHMRMNGSSSQRCCSSPACIPTRRSAPCRGTPWCRSWTLPALC